MAKMKGGGDVFGDGGAGPFSNVTRENYHELARAYTRMAFGGVVVSEYAAPARWQAWLAYLDGLGVKTAYARKERTMTVPAAWPSDFDLNAPPQPPPRGSAPPELSISRRTELVGMLRDIVGRTSIDKPRPKGFVGLDALCEAYAARPKPFTLKFEEGVDAFADHGPPGCGPGLAKQHKFEPRLERDDQSFDSFEERELLP